MTGLTDEWLSVILIIITGLNSCERWHRTLEALGSLGTWLFSIWYSHCIRCHLSLSILKRKVSVCYFHFQYFAKILYLILFIVLVKFKIQFSWQKIEIWFCFLKLEKDKNILENNISKWNQMSWYPYIAVMNNWQYQKLADLKIMCDVLRTVWFSHFGHIDILMGA